MASDGYAWIDFGSVLHGLKIDAWIFNFDQFSSNLYDFCLIFTFPNNSTQKHKSSEKYQIISKIIN